MANDLTVTGKTPDDLELNPQNPRKHPEAALEKLERSIQRFGWTNPILIDDDGTVLAGHARLKAARRMGRDEVPCIEVDLADDEALAYMLADNRLQEETGWIEEELQTVVSELQEHDFALDMTGFDGAEIEAMFDDEEFELEEVPEVEDPPEDATTQDGDVWELGDHRLVCGDATDPEVWEALGDREHALCVTDPPYGVEVDHGWRDEVANRSASPRSGTIEGDSRADWRAVWGLMEARVVYLWHGALYAGLALEGLCEADYEVRQQIVWVKDVHSLSRSHYHWKHEPCWYAVKDGATANWQGDHSQMTVWEMPSPIMSTSEDQTGTDHPTQKPLEVYATPLRNHTRPGDGLVDPFTGSGSGLLACEQLNRRFDGIEKDPKWCDVAVDRWEQFTGQDARRINLNQQEAQSRENWVWLHRHHVGRTL